MNITVVGSGGWGTALAKLLHHNGHTVTIWSFAQSWWPARTKPLRKRSRTPL